MITQTDYIYVAPGFNRKYVILATKKFLYVCDTESDTTTHITTYFLKGKKVHEFFEDLLADNSLTLEGLHQELSLYTSSKEPSIKIYEIAKLKHFDVKASFFSSAIFGDEKFGMGWKPIVISVGKQKTEMKAFYLDQLKK